MNQLNRAVLASCVGALAFSYGAQAYEAGDVIARIGTHYIDPKSDNSDLVSVNGAWGATGSAVYFVAPTLAIDLLLAVPYRHDIQLNSGGDVASTRHLPPTLSLAWYPDLSPTFKPYLGAGINYTMFFDEKTKGALSGTKLSLDNSVGLALVAGLQVELNRGWGLTFDVRYLDIDTDARVDGTSIGTVEVDPIAYGAAVSYRF